jgi:hypothetical protein
VGVINLGSTRDETLEEIQGYIEQIERMRRRAAEPAPVVPLTERVSYRMGLRAALDAKANSEYKPRNPYPPGSEECVIWQEVFDQDNESWVRTAFGGERINRLDRALEELAGTVPQSRAPVLDPTDIPSDERGRRFQR